MDHNAPYEKYRRPTRRDVLLAKMQDLVPWSALCSVIEPCYPKAGTDRPPVGLECMLRMFCNEWHFGMKLQIWVDKDISLSHSAMVTEANVHDKHRLPQLLHGQEQEVYGDSVDASQQALIASKAPNARDATKKRVREGGPGAEIAQLLNKSKSHVRSRVEHVFAVAKRLWGLSKVLATSGWPETPLGRSWRSV